MAERARLVLPNEANSKSLRVIALPHSEMRAGAPSVQETSNSPRGAAAGVVVPVAALIRGDEPGKSGRASAPTVATHARPAAQLGRREGKSGARDVARRRSYGPDLVRPTAGLLRARETVSRQPHKLEKPRATRGPATEMALAWSGFAAPEPLSLVDRVSPAAVLVAMLAGFGFAVGVGSLWFG